MEIVLTSEQMRAVDSYAIKHLKIPGTILMENAGRSVVDAIERSYGPLMGKSAVVFCGKGSNGGDGYVIARHLYNRGTKVTIVALGRIEEIKGDARLNFDILKRFCREYPQDGSLGILELHSPLILKRLKATDFVVDAVFGTGFSGAVKGAYRRVIEWINRSSAVKVSVDIPSGLNSDNGSVENVAVKSDLTVTMAFKKIGLLTGKSKNYIGRLEVADIGLFSKDLSMIAPRTFLVESHDLIEALPRRAFDAHKHSVGKVFVLAGSRGLTGAAAMVSESTLRVGAGAVILGAPKSIYPILARKLTEVMVEPLDETADGSVSTDALASIRKHIDWADVVVIGPGLSRNSDTQEVVRTLIGRTNKPLLIDADGLNALSGDVSVLRKRRTNDIIVTPHSGELSRLIGVKSSEIDARRVEIARKVAQEFHLTIVLKGAPTVTGSPAGNVYINSTGNPGMATAGSGDVLAGIVAGLWAQGMQPDAAAYCGVFVHGLAGDIAQEKLGEKSLLALDIQHMVPKAFLDVHQAQRT